MRKELITARLARLSTRPGLCAGCAHLRLVESARSVFVRCGLAEHDPRFPRYPALPVLGCEGYRTASNRVERR
jgi:hypothetical protein